MILKTKTIVLPVSMIKCEIGLSLFDRLQIQKATAILSSKQSEFQKAKTETEKANAIIGITEMFADYYLTIMKAGIKSWDHTTKITDDELKTIEQDDYKLAEKEIMGLFRKAVKQPDENDNKKKESTLEQSKTNTVKKD